MVKNILVFALALGMAGCVNEQGKVTVDPRVELALEVLPVVTGILAPSLVTPERLAGLNTLTTLVKGLGDDDRTEISATVFTSKLAEECATMRIALAKSDLPSDDPARKVYSDVCTT